MPAMLKEIRESCRIPEFAELLIHEGKVRNTYQVKPGVMLLQATNRLSAFDFVLPVLVPSKGDVLTALTHFWLTGLLKDILNHLLESEKFPGKNYAYELAYDFPDMPLASCLVVRKFKVMPFELIFRAHLGGSVWEAYEKIGIVAGQRLPVGLTKWSKLAEPIFTPSTKAEEGHDVNITAEEFFAQTGEAGKKAVAMLSDVYQRAYAYAKERGILILDTKFEVGIDENGDVVLIDEVLTPDSSRFTTVDDFDLAMSEGRDPIFYDKEPVRIYLKSIETPFGVTGIHKLDPLNPEHVAFVHALKIPEEIIVKTSVRYRDVASRLLGMDLKEYQDKNLLVAA